jgi:hypothetical protein
MNRSKLLLLITATLSVSSAHATIPLYLWDNQEGLIPAQSCEIVSKENIPFRITRYWGRGQDPGTENLRNYKGVRQSHLVNGSLVKLVQGKRKKLYEKVEVVGLNENTSRLKNRWFSERLDRGYLFNKSLVPLDDFLLELNGNTLGDAGKKLPVMGNSFWKIESQDSYYNVKCNNVDREYTLFRVYNTVEDSDPAAFVGVYWDETKIFKHFKAHPFEQYRDENVELERGFNLQDLIDESEAKYILDFDTNNVEEESSEPAIDFMTKSLRPKARPQNIPYVLKALESEERTEVVEETPAPKTEDFTTSQVSIESQVCVPTRTLNVRTESLNEVVFRAKGKEKVKIFQSWDGEQTKLKTIDGVEYTFVKVEFPDREETDQREGWIAEKFISPLGQCKYDKVERERGIPVDTQITGLDDPKCCEFPTVKKPTHSYTSGMRMFGARRGGGKRTHAACDLYRYKNEPALSVAPGKVIRGLYYFYQGTYAIEVKHSGGFVVRYGELTGKKAAGVAQGKTVKMGQKLGFIGKVNSNCCRPMLHFELYRGNKKGSLSTSGTKYQRRSDLMNPTKYLLKWEEANL